MGRLAPQSPQELIEASNVLASFLHTRRLHGEMCQDIVCLNPGRKNGQQIELPLVTGYVERKTRFTREKRNHLSSRSLENAAPGNGELASFHHQ